MGGHAAGEVASQMAVDLISRELADLNDLTAPDAGERVSNTLRLANKTVFQRTTREIDKTGMGSTASALLLSDTHYLIGHVGDSRIYLVRDGAMRQLTRDHSLVQEQVDAGLITAEQARHHPQSNVITCCIGMSSDIEPSIITGETKVGDVFLLASDGLTGMVEDRRLQQLLQSRAAPERIVNAMIADANNNGGIDNITAIVVKVVTADTDFPTGEVTPIPQPR
jgi:protein phosphatase